VIKSHIIPARLQEVLASAANAALKGQAQWFTPLPWSRILALPLPRYRPVITDLTCGNGALLDGAANHSKLLGIDIEAVDSRFVAADLTQFFPLLHAVKWQGDLFVLNPPWDLHWYRDRLQGLKESDCPAVRQAFAVHDGRVARGTMDSTIATLCIALDRCSPCGEGYLIANEATLQRLIFAKDAPYHFLSLHVWAHLIIKGNICEPKSKIDTGVIYFARSPQTDCHSFQCPTFEAAKLLCEELRRKRLTHRRGPENTPYLHTKESLALTLERWQAAAEECMRSASREKPQYNLWLNPNGIIETYLSLFDQHNGRVSKTEAAALFALNGKRPLQLVMQRQHRKALEAAVGIGGLGTVWQVDPALPAAVQAAVTEYNAVRAPLYPLSKIQRLGYLDEQDEIQCIKNLNGAFTEGRNYSLCSTTLAVKRSGAKMNLEGELDEVEWNAQELAFFITDNAGVERCFMEARLRDPNIEINLLLPNGKPGRKRDLGEKCRIDFTLQELVEHFQIPEVPDVATLNPEGYQRNLAALDEIVALCNHN